MVFSVKFIAGVTRFYLRYIDEIFPIIDLLPKFRDKQITKISTLLLTTLLQEEVNYLVISGSWSIPKLRAMSETNRFNSFAVSAGISGRW